MSIVVDTLILGSIRTNCHIVTDEASMDAVIIDPADEAEKILQAVSKKGCKVKAVLLTHGHFDHMYGAAQVIAELRVPLYAGEEEEELLENPSFNLSVMGDYGPVGLKADYWLKDGERLSLGTLSFTVISTPGHTKGGISYYMEEDGILFSGDTLFWEGVGRTDFPTGNGGVLVKSIQEKLMPLPDAVKVYTGHGAATQIDYERNNNPYINGIY